MKCKQCNRRFDDGPQCAGCSEQELMITCAYCDSMNRYGTSNCVQCGALLGRGTLIFEETPKQKSHSHIATFSRRIVNHGFEFSVLFDDGTQNRITIYDWEIRDWPITELNNKMQERVMNGLRLNQEDVARFEELRKQNIGDV